MDKFSLGLNFAFRLILEFSRGFIFTKRAFYIKNFDEIRQKCDYEYLYPKIFARNYFHDLRFPKFSRGLNVAKMAKNRENRENLPT